MLELLALDQWVLWKSVKLKSGKFTKPPFHSSGRYKADITNPIHLSSSKKVFNFLKNHGEWGGAGFALTEKDHFVVIDLDKCIDPKTGNINDTIKTIIKKFDSATEISPSGKGFHILCKGKLDGKSWHKNSQLNFEIYDRKRYITVTGNHYAGTPKIIKFRQGAIDWFLKEFKPQTVIISNENFTHDSSFDIYLGDSNANAPENKLKALCSNNMNFRKLWKKERPEFEGKSFSEYDMGLCYHMTAAKWSPQEMADTIIHFRREWGSSEDHEKALVRYDYHERTQKKAAWAVKKNYTDFAADIEEIIDKGDPEEAFALFKQKTGIPCERIVRRGLDPVKFYFIIGHRQRSLGGGKELLNQNHIRAKVVESSGHVVKMFTMNSWHKIVNLMYAASEFEAFEDVDKVRSFFASIRDYLESSSNQIVNDKPQSIFKRWPFFEKGKVYICAEEFFKFLVRQRGEKAELNEVRYQFRESGFSSQKLSATYCKIKISRSFWSIKKKEVEDGQFIASSRPTRDRKDKSPVKEGGAGSGGTGRK